MGIAGNGGIMLTISRFDGNFFFLSNFFHCNILIDGKNYKTVEHYFQAMKTLDPVEHEKIRLADSPRDAKRFGRKVKIRDDWDDVKEHIMITGLRAKFNDDPLQTMLVKTSPIYLIEGNDWNDTYWGICNGVGENRLGKLLMLVRSALITGR